MEQQAAENIISSLNENKVEYVIIGAFAFSSIGYTRDTLDIDILIKPEIKNIRKCRTAIESLGYDFQDMTDEDILKYKILFRGQSNRLDIHPSVKGVTFKEIWKNKKTECLGKTKGYFASLNDLIKMKKAAGRPKDIEDLKYLEEIKKQTKENRSKKGQGNAH
ncbi:MAG: hypothetical protein CVU78_00295 [Elusimicrobia bacterium HGW-Elusimicrobia-2]|nr:MAG: hypothetical protein CVU78_00295 [Elusimicrobia bacterium HGW-Elusimicrobia-2]